VTKHEEIRLFVSLVTMASLDSDYNDIGYLESDALQLDSKITKAFKRMLPPNSRLDCSTQTFQRILICRLSIFTHLLNNGPNE
jgi:hypothetical protein